MAAPLLSLPQDILGFIANYLLPEPQQNKIIFRYSYDWRNFLNSSKKYFGQWKKESQIIVLTDSYARRFRVLKGFREEIYQCVENPRFQLDVVFDEEGEGPEVNLQSLGSMRKIHLNYYDCLAPPAMDVDEISLVECRIKDFFFCSNIKSVEVFQLDEPFDGIFDFSLFQNIEKGVFSLGSTLTVNHHLLSNLKSLELYSSAITDVSCFQNIPHLTLNWCSGITDVSSLGKVHTLDLFGCANIRDVSALGRVNTLDLSHCIQVTDLSALEWVYSLTFEGGFLGTDLSGLTNIVILNILEAMFVTDITMLQSLQVLNMLGCEGITSLSGLSRLKELWIYDSDIKRITRGNEVFPQLTTLHLIGEYPPCSQFLQTLDHLHDLELHSFDWNDSSCISLLPGLCSLTLSYCGGFTTLPQLPVSLGYLKIIDCRLESLIIARKEEAAFPLYDLIIENCHLLKKLQIDEKVFKCKISRCYKLSSIIVNEQIGYLIIRRVESLEKVVHYSKIVSPVLFFNPERVLTVDQKKDELRVGK
jgi:hypothetical protein